jgi:cyanophycinase
MGRQELAGSGTQFDPSENIPGLSSSCYIAPVLRSLFSLLLLFALSSTEPARSSYQYIRLGNHENVETKPISGIALMGGGSDIDEAFRWLCEKANGGDFLILRARGSDAYNPYVNGLCKLNSVATLIIPDRDAALDPTVTDIVRHAAAIFIAGGDQARYVNFWRGTPVQQAINADIASGKPIGGTSAGLAILGEFSYGALNDPPDDSSLTSAEALHNPFVNQITLVRDFLVVPILRTTITDSHFAKRDRMGRSLVFLARLLQDGWTKNPRETAVDERSAVLVEPDGKTKVVGSGKGAYFLRPTENPFICKRDVPLTFHNISVYKVPSGGQFDLRSWTGEGGVQYMLTVDAGVIASTATNHAVY